LISDPQATGGPQARARGARRCYALAAHQAKYTIKQKLEQDMKAA
jgi:hypothetical protein